MATENSELRVIINGEDRFSPVVQRFESGLIRAVGAISSAMATLSTLAFPIRQAANLEREMANVAKTTQFSAQQIANLTRELAQLSLTTDTSAVDLAKIAAAAGQQGLGREGVEGIRQFTESVARMASVLDLTAEDAGRSIGKILNIFQIPLKDVEKTVSSINQISNNSTARANELINVLKRLGDAGGSLQFTQALALSATALDLGATPEVAGTTLSKFESAIKVRNKQFAELLGRDRDRLAKEASEDGFKVFTEVLAELNKLSLKDREATVTKLFGGGRINALADKFLQDSLKASPILTKNLNQAVAGETSGTSAIREQQTVLQTFNKQVEILTNSFKELGRQAGEGLLIPLTGYVTQLRVALQQPGLKSFAEAVVRAFGELTGVIVNTTKYIAELGINWENFLAVFKVVAVVKLLEAFQKLAGMIPGVSASIAFMTGASKAAAAGSAADAAKQVTAWGALRAAVDQATGSWRAYAQAKRDASLADINAQRTQKAAADAAAREALLKQDANAKQLSAKVATNNLGLAQANLAAAKQNAGKALIQADALAQQAVRDAQVIGQKKMEAAEAAHQQRINLIQQEFRGVRTNAEKATRDGILASEQTHFTRQLAALRAADARRIAQAETTARVIVGIASQQASQEIAIAEAKVAQQRALANAAAASASAAGAAALGAGANTAAARAAASAAATATADNLTRLQRARQVAVEAFNGVQRAMGLLSAAFGFLVRMAGPVVFWLTAIYTVLDLLGLADKLPGIFNSLTDAIGLTSEASRKKAEQDKKLHAEHEQQKKDLDDLIERYGKLKSVKTGLLDEGKVAELQGEFESARTAQDFQNAATKLAEIISAQDAEQRKAEENLRNLPNVYNEVIDKIKAKEKEIADLRDRIARAPSADGAAAIGIAQGGRVINVPQMQQDLQAAEQGLKDLRKEAANVGPGIVEGIQKTIPGIQKNLDTVNNLVQKLFTPESVKLMEVFAPEIVALQTELARLTQARKDEETKLSSHFNAQSDKDAREAIKRIDQQIDGQQAAIKGKLDAIRKAMKDVASDPSVTEATKTTALGVLSLLDLNTKIIETFLSRLGALQQAGATFTGIGLDPKTFGQPVPQGTKTGNVDPDKEASKRVKARADIEKAAHEAERARQRQANEELLDANRRFFDRGLLDLRTYYENKERLDTQNLEADLQRVQQDIASKQKERKAADLKESDRLRITAEITSLEGQRDVIEAKIRALPGQLEAALDKEMKAFNEGVISDKIDLVKILGLNDFGDAIDLQFELITSQIKEKVERLKSELAKGTPGVTQAFIDQFQLSQLVKTLDPALQLIAEKARLTGDAVSNAIQRIQSKRDQGKLTDREAEALTNKARAVEAEATRQQIERMTQLQDKFLEKAVAEQTANGVSAETARASIQQTEEWKKQENALDSLKNKYQELSQVIDDTARSINQSIEDGLSSALEDFANGTQKNLLKAVVGFGNDLAKSINAILARDVAQNFIKDFLGGGGTGGIGGVFSRLFKTGSIFGGDEGAGNSLVDKDLLGRDAGHAMYVQMVRGQDNVLEKPTSGFFEKLFGKKGDSPLDFSKDVPLPDLDPFGAEGLKAEDFSGFSEAAKDATSDILESATDLFDADGGLGSIIEPGFEMFGIDFTSAMDSVFSSIGGNANEWGQTLSDVIGSIFSDISDSSSSDAEGWGSSLSSTISSIFSSLTSQSGGDSDTGFFSSIGSWISSLFAHTGGLVGSPSMGRMQVSPFVFANAVRYHTGGIAGLQPDEVPTILKKGEEVLTATDPRHRNNSGGNVSAPVTMIIQTPDANSFRRSQDQIASTTGAAINRSIRRNR